MIYSTDNDDFNYQIGLMIPYIVFRSSFLQRFLVMYIGEAVSDILFCVDLIIIKLE